MNALEQIVAVVETHLKTLSPKECNKRMNALRKRAFGTKHPRKRRTR